MVKQVFGTGNTSISMIIAKDILNRFFSLYANARASSKFMDYYREKFLLRGRRVTFLEDGKKRGARVLGFDTASYALMLEGRGDRIHYVTSPKNIILPKKISPQKRK